MYVTLKRAALLAMLSVGMASVSGCIERPPHHSFDRWGSGHMAPGANGHHGWGWQHMHPGQRQRAIRHWTYMNQGVPKAYRGKHNPLRATDETLAGGALLYRENCAACHGPRGLGNGEAARSLSPSPAILTHLVRTPMAADEYLLWAISDGGGDFGTDMPAFKGTLSRSEIWQIISYMRAGFPDIR